LSFISREALVICYFFYGEFFKYFIEVWGCVQKVMHFIFSFRLVFIYLACTWQLYLFSMLVLYIYIYGIIGIFTPTSLTLNRPWEKNMPAFMERRKERKKEGRKGREKENNIILVLATPWKLLFLKH